MKRVNPIMPAATFAQKIIFAVKIREYTKKALSGSFLWSPFLLSLLVGNATQVSLIIKAN